MAGKKILLLLDDAAGHEQVRPLLPGAAGSLVLVTSRRRLTALDDSAVISLGALSPGEAAALLARLAARPGIGAADAAVGEITRLCGYLPLAIGMLARQLSQHPAWTAGDLAASLAAARDRLAAMRAENLSVAAAFDLSYADLAPARQRLFRRLGLIPGPSFDACAAAALDDTTLDRARRGLEDLYDQHLITEPAPGRYLLHDLLREHARTLAAAGDPADSRAAAGRLLEYYLHTALACRFGRPPPGQPPAHAPGLAAAEQAAAWLETERPNLHAAADYAAATGRHQCAIAISALTGDFLRAHGHRDRAAALHLFALASAASGRRPARPGAGPDRPGRYGKADRRVPGGRRQPRPGCGALPRPGRSIRPSPCPLQSGLPARADRGLPGGNRHSRAGAGAGPRLRRPARRGRSPRRPRPGATANRGAPGCRRESGERAGPVPRPRAPARPGRRARRARQPSTADRRLPGRSHQPAA